MIKSCTSKLTICEGSLIIAMKFGLKKVAGVGTCRGGSCVLKWSRENQKMLLERIKAENRGKSVTISCQLSHEVS